MIIVPVSDAFQKRAPSTSTDRVGSDAKANPAKVKHGHTVWLLLAGSPHRQEGRFDEPSNGCVLKADFDAFRAQRAEANRKRKPYDQKTMRSPSRSGAVSTSFVRDPAVALAVESSTAGLVADPASSPEADHGPRPSRSLMDRPGKTEAVRRRHQGGQPEDGIPIGALPA